MSGQDEEPISLGKFAGEVVPSEVLMSGRRQLLIAHEGDVYRLRITSKGKLILTK